MLYSSVYHCIDEKAILSGFLFGLFASQKVKINVDMLWYVVNDASLVLSLVKNLSCFVGKSQKKMHITSILLANGACIVENDCFLAVIYLENWVTSSD